MQTAPILDAAGKPAAPLTRHELRLRESIQSGEVQRRYNALERRRALPLHEKVELSLERIREFGEAFGWHVSSSFSGGMDSTVMVDLVERVRPGLPRVFCNTGLEYPEICRHVKRTANVVVMRPRVPFHRVVRDEGWPIASKRVARGVCVLRNPTGQNQNIWRLYDQGINRRGEAVSGFKVPQQWRFLVNAPFNISDKCCDIMKKEPMHRYERETGRVQFVGIMASESKGREKTYVEVGCNAYDLKHPRSWPLAFWTRQDVLEYIRMRRLSYASVYGDIVDGPNGLETTGVNRTGCVFCLFGLQMETGENRIQRLARTHPRLWKYCVERLGMGEVFKFCRDNAMPRLAAKFRAEPGQVMRSLALPGLYQ